MQQNRSLIDACNKLFSHRFYLYMIGWYIGPDGLFTCFHLTYTTFFFTHKLWRPYSYSLAERASESQTMNNPKCSGKWCNTYNLWIPFWFWSHKKFESNHLLEPFYFLYFLCHGQLNPLMTIGPYFVYKSKIYVYICIKNIHQKETQNITIGSCWFSRHGSILGNGRRRGWGRSQSVTDSQCDDLILWANGNHLIS